MLKTSQAFSVIIKYLYFWKNAIPSFIIVENMVNIFYLIRQIHWKF